MKPLTTLAGKVLVNLTTTINQRERYTYIYQGNAQSLDHILVTKNLAHQTRYDQVHINTELTQTNSDHDPIIAATKLEKILTE